MSDFPLPRYACFAYRRNGYDTCRSCIMNEWDSEFEYHLATDLEDAARFFADLGWEPTERKIVPIDPAIEDQASVADWDLYNFELPGQLEGLIHSREQRKKEEEQARRLEEHARRAEEQRQQAIRDQLVREERERQEYERLKAKYEGVTR